MPQVRFRKLQKKVAHFWIMTRVLGSISADLSCLNICSSDFASFGGSVIVDSLDRLLQHLRMNAAIDKFPLQENIALETAAGLV